VGFVEGRIYRRWSARGELSRSCEERTRGNKMPRSGARRRKGRWRRKQRSRTGDLELEVLLLALLLLFCLLDLFSSSVPSRTTVASSVSSSSTLVPFSSFLWLGRRRGRGSIVLKLLFEGGVTSLSLNRADFLCLGLPKGSPLFVIWALFPS